MRNQYLPAFVLLLAVCIAPIAAADDNLLARPDLAFLVDQSSGLSFDGTLKIKDGNLETSSLISLSDSSQTELVFSFSETLTPTSLAIQTAGLEKDQASIEILVSEDGPDSGYLSLRTEPLKASNSWQRFTFEPAAARWLMVKIAPYGAPVEFDLAELEINGYVGPPVSLYAFDESPSKAIDVLNSLEQIDLSFDIHADEIALLKDAEDGQFDTWTFAEASLISSGVLDATERAVLLEQLDVLTEEARTATATESSAFGKGRVLLEWLHERSMSKGYVEKQTDMSAVLNDNIYNCVSSATLYNIIGKRIGLDARGIEVPDHAFTILYDGTNHVDVETTTPGGFDPARDRAAINAFARTTGYTYINDKNRAKRREIDDAGMIALTYYNHGVLASQENDFTKALLYYFRALSLDSQNKSTVKNILALLGRWSGDEIDKENYPLAVNIIDAALQFAPEDRTSRHIMRFALMESMLQSTSAEQTAEHVAFAQELAERTGDNTFTKLHASMLQIKAYDFFDQGQYEQALELTQNLDPNSDEATHQETKRLRVSLFLGWSTNVFDAGDYATALDILERALIETPNDSRVKNNIQYTAQEWSAFVLEAKGAEPSNALLLEVAARFPDITALKRLSASNYNSDAAAALDAGDFEGAIAIYQTAQKLGVTDRIISDNEKVVWNQWGISRIEQNDFPGALAIFEKAIAAHPKYSSYNQNVAFVVQEWGISIYEAGNVLDAERNIVIQSERFPNVSGVASQQGKFISLALQNTKTVDEFAALAPILKDARTVVKKQSALEKVVSVFYQDWAKTIDPNFASEDVLPILQLGVTDHPENAHVKKLFIFTIDSLARDAINAADWPTAAAIYQSASRSLPSERSFEKKLEEIRAQM